MSYALPERTFKPFLSAGSRAMLLAMVMLLYATAYTYLGLQHVAKYIPFAVVLLTVWFAVKMLRRERLARTPLAAPLVGLVLAAMLATAFSVDPRLSLPALLNSLVLVLIFFLVCDLLLGGWSPYTFVRALVLLGAFLLAQGLISTGGQYWTWWRLAVPEYPPFLVPYRLYGVAGHPNQLAALVNLALPFAIIGLARARGPSGRLGYSLWLLAAVVVLFFTQSRGGWVAASVVTAITVGWLLLRSGRPRSVDAAGWLRASWRVWAIMLVCLAVFATLFITNRALSPSEYSTSGGSLASAGGRTEFWAVAIQSFLMDPLTGVGPSVYARSYVDASSTVMAFLPPNAHSLLLNKLAEEGLMGVLAATWLLGVGGWVLVRAYRGDGAGTPSRVDRPLLVGVSAALAGFLVHGLVDVPNGLPATSVALIVLLAVGMKAAGAIEQDRRRLTSWAVVALLVPLLLLPLVHRQVAGFEAMAEGIAYGWAGDWVSAARAVDAAIAADPGLSFYYAQRGYAYGMVAEIVGEDDRLPALGTAAASYSLARQAGPLHVPDLLNAAALHDRLGETDQAEQLLLAAADRSRDWALPTLLLAERHVGLGEVRDAERLFIDALGRQPAASETAACRRNPVCRHAALHVREPSMHAAYALDEARALLAQDRTREALDVLERIPITSPDPSPWVARAEAHLALGQLPQARYAAQVAEALRGSRSPRAALVNARLHLVAGEQREAIVALEAVARPSIRAVAYSSFVFGRLGLPGLLLPDLSILEGTADDLAVYRELARLYVVQDRTADAEWAQKQADDLAMLLTLGESDAA